MIHHSQTCINITTTYCSHDSIRHLKCSEKSVPLYGPSLPSGQSGFKNHEEFRRSPHLSFFSFTNLAIHTYFLHFNPNRVRSLLGLLTKQHFGDFIDMTLTDEDPYTKVVDIVVEFNSHKSLLQIACS